MSKPIINGIDVSECSYYNKDNEPYCCEIWDNECEAQNCYFKQLKRLQEENKELKLALDMFNKQCKKINVENIEKSFNIYIECTKNLKKENEKLKDEIKNNKTALQIELGAYNMECGNLLKENEELLDENKKYKQALEEIKKWATNHIPCDIDPEVKCTKEDCFNCLNYDIKKIIKIINEVLNDRN